jgi:hypothetical protein
MIDLCRDWDWVLVVIGAMLLLAAICLGGALGSWRCERAEARAYKQGRIAGFNEAQNKFSHIRPSAVPTLTREQTK